MNRLYCTSCLPCKNLNLTYCDNCEKICCEENMKNHREIFYLGDQFQTKVNYAENELCSKADQVKNNLYKICNINIDESRYCLDKCENFLSSMINKYYEMGSDKNKLSNKIEKDKNEFEKDKMKLKIDFEQKLKELNESFEKEKNSIKNEINNENIKKETEIINLNNSKINFEKEKKNILNKNVDLIINDFINKEKPKIEDDYQKEKNLIDEKNKLIKQNLEYTEKEKKLENDYLTTICNIKNYSKKIPYFDNWIKVYNLNKYLV